MLINDNLPKSRLMTNIIAWGNRLLKSAPILILFSIIILLLQMNVLWFFSKLFGTVLNPTATSTFAFIVFCTIIFFLIVPIALSQFIFKEKLTDLGLQSPVNKKIALLIIMLSLLILIPCVYSFSLQKSFQLTYSLGPLTLPKFVIINFLLMPIYYFAEEFFFRGFLFITLWRKIRWHSFWITDIIFTLTHLGKPGLEILMCIPLSVLLNSLTLITRSLYPAIFVHYSIGLLIITLVNFKNIIPS